MKRQLFGEGNKASWRIIEKYELKSTSAASPLAYIVQVFLHSQWIERILTVKELYPSLKNNSVLCVTNANNRAGTNVFLQYATKTRTPLKTDIQSLHRSSHSGNNLRTWNEKFKLLSNGPNNACFPSYEGKQGIQAFGRTSASCHRDLADNTN